MSGMVKLPFRLLRGGDKLIAKLFRERRGEGYIDVCVLVLCAMLVVALAVRVLSGCNGQEVRWSY